MSSIKISDLQLTGFDLLEDAESYLQELSNDDQVSSIMGGTSVWTRPTTSLPTISITRPTTSFYPIEEVAV